MPVEPSHPLPLPGTGRIGRCRRGGHGDADEQVGARAIVPEERLLGLIGPGADRPSRLDGAGRPAGPGGATDRVGIRPTGSRSQPRRCSSGLVGGAARSVIVPTGWSGLLAALSILRGREAMDRVGRSGITIPGAAAHVIPSSAGSTDWRAAAQWFALGNHTAATAQRTCPPLRRVPDPLAYPRTPTDDSEDAGVQLCRGTA
jgi:hypothetical protein